MTVVAEEDAILACTVRAPQYLSADHKAALCAGVYRDAATAPADCASHLKLHLGTSTSSEIALALCSGATGVGPATCFHAVSSFSSTILPLPHLLTLCRGAADEEPALCYLQLHRKLQLDVHAILLLCRQPNAWSAVDDIVACLQRHSSLAHATRLRLCAQPHLVSAATLPCLETLAHRHALASDRHALFPLCLTHAPHHALACLEAAPWGYTTSFKASLCLNATGLGPVECMKGLVGASAWSSDDKVGLCGGAVSAKPVACVLQLSSRYTIRQKVALCAHDNDTPLLCSQALKGRQTTGDEIALCGRTTSLDPAHCFNADTGLSTASKVELCASGGTRDRAHCVLRLRSMLHTFTSSDLVQLCAALSSAADLPGLTQCLAAGFRAVLAAPVVVRACTGAASAAPALCLQEHLHGWSSAEKAELCHLAKDLAPVDCIRRLGPTALLQRRHQVQLCARAASPVFPAVCAKTAPPNFLRPVDRIRLCAQAASSLPLDCATRLASVEPSVVAAVCSQATSLAPAECIQSAVRRNTKLTQSVVERCRAATSLPSTLALAFVSKECQALVRRCPVTIGLHVLDQFGQRMLMFPPASPGESNHSMRVTATFQSQPYPGVGGREPVANGTATFHLSFPQAGHYGLVATLANTTALHLPVHVLADPAASQWTATCDRIFISHLECVPSDVPFPSHQILQVAAGVPALLATACTESFEFLEPLSPWLSASAPIIAAAPWLPYHLHLQVPLSPWEVLRLPDTASPDAVRAAYRQQSLVFHPDRSDATGDAAAAYFDKVRIAYETATKPPKDDQPDNTLVDK